MPNSNLQYIKREMKNATGVKVIILDINCESN